MADEKKKLSVEDLDNINGGLVIEYHREKTGRISYAIRDEINNRIIEGGEDLESTIRKAEAIGASTDIYRAEIKY